MKPPETPQDVAAAGAALIEVAGAGRNVCIVGAELDAGSSFVDGIPPVVMVMVAKVGASDMIS